MAESTVLDAINTVNTEAVPKALNAALALDESISEIGSRTKSFERDADTLLEQYKRQLDEQLMTAELRIDDTERKLSVLLKRLSKDTQDRASHVEEETLHRKSLADDFIEESKQIDEVNDSFDNLVENFKGGVSQMSDDINSGVDAYQSMADEMHDQISSAYDGYQQLHAAQVGAIAGTLSAGTQTMMDKMTDLESLVEGSLGQYSDTYTEVLSFLGGQSEDESGGFEQVLSFAEDTVGGVAEVFDGSIGDIAEKLESVADLIETIEPILEFIDALA